jgi:anti-sigma B factor antagonist
MCRWKPSNRPGIIGDEVRMPDFSAEAKSFGDRAVLSIVGEVDLESAPTLSDLGRASLDSSQTETLVIELGGVTFMDSTGIAALVNLRNTAQELNKQLVLAAVPDRVHKLLRITGLDLVFVVEDRSSSLAGGANMPSSSADHLG